MAVTQINYKKTFTKAHIHHTNKQTDINTNNHQHKQTDIQQQQQKQQQHRPGMLKSLGQVEPRQRMTASLKSTNSCMDLFLPTCTPVWNSMPSSTIRLMRLCTTFSAWGGQPHYNTYCWSYLSGSILYKTDFWFYCVGSYR